MRKFFAVVLLLSACGDIKLGSPGPINDPLPSGSVQASGSLNKLGANQTLGTAAIWKSNDASSYILRLEQLDVPVNPRNHVFLLMNGNSILITALKSPLGNQNYPISTGGVQPLNWGPVTIRTGSDPVISTKVAEGELR